MARHDMSAETSSQRKSPFKIHPVSIAQSAQPGTTHGLRHHVSRKISVPYSSHGQAHSVDGDAVTGNCPLQYFIRLYFKDYATHPLRD